MKTILFLLFSLFFVQNAFAQTAADIKKIEDDFQTCLDTGNNMLGCTRHFYAEMDSILNKTYNNYHATLAQAEKDNLKIEQKEWLKQRDAYFKK